jgi:hypothetical protein
MIFAVLCDNFSGTGVKLVALLIFQAHIPKILSRYLKVLSVKNCDRPTHLKYYEMSFVATYFSAGSLATRL